MNLRDICPGAAEVLLGPAPASAPVEPPTRRFKLTLEIGGDTMQDLLSLLDHFAEELPRGLTGCAHSGCSAGGSFQLIEDHNMAHEKYVTELHEYLEKKKHERPA
jgi:hypothetical protein